MTWATPVTVSAPGIIAALLVAAAVVVLPSRSRRYTAGAGGPGEEAEVGPPPGPTPRLPPGPDGLGPEPARRDGPVAGLLRRLPRPRSGRHGAAESASVHDVAAAMALLALAYRTGLPTWQVLSAVARTTAGPVARDLRQVAAALQWGADEGEAWAAVGEAWRPAARVVVLSHAAGVAPGPLLTTAADDLSRTEIDRLEMAVAQVGVRLVAPLGLVLLPAFCLTTVVPLVVALGRQLLAG